MWEWEDALVRRIVDKTSQFEIVAKVNTHAFFYYYYYV